MNVDQLEGRALNAAVHTEVFGREWLRCPSYSIDPSANEQVVGWLAENDDGYRTVMEREAGWWTVGFEGVEGFFYEQSHPSRLVAVCRFALAVARAGKGQERT